MVLMKNVVWMLLVVVVIWLVFVFSEDVSVMDMSVMKSVVFVVLVIC